MIKNIYSDLPMHLLYDLLITTVKNMIRASDNNDLDTFTTAKRQANLIFDTIEKKRSEKNTQISN